jgi:hypothetical protein
MHVFVRSSAKKPLLALAAIFTLVVSATALHAQYDPNDPPPQAGRISVTMGQVSIQPAGTDDWGQAYPNLPMGPGDRIYTDNNSRAEIQIGQNYLRIGPNTDITLTHATPTRMDFAVGRGSVHIRSFGFWPGQMLYLQTPNGSVTLDQPSELRADILPDDDATVYTAINGYGYVSSYGVPGFNLQSGQAIEFFGSNPVATQWLAPAPFDALDGWSQQRDVMITNPASFQYVSPEVPGAAELSAAGQWTPGSPYGPIWFPNNVAIGWAPYRYGHWVSRTPWGWIWVEDEPWGYAPFHYGRWVQWGGRWGWVPGPPASHPVWSPALVVFAGGIHVGGGAVSVWFPLGPGEAFHPWYPASPAYINQVNITNITPAPRVVVQTTYVTNVNITNITYVNRTVGVTAIPQDAMASGRPVGQVHLQVDPQTIAHAQVLARPEVAPPAKPFAGPPPQRPVPTRVAAAHPTVMNEKGQLVAATPHAQPATPPVKPAPQVRPPAGRAAVAPPPGAKAPNKPASPGGKPAAASVRPEQAAAETRPAAKPTTPEEKPATSATQSAKPGQAANKQKPADKNKPKPEEKKPEK